MKKLTCLLIYGCFFTVVVSAQNYTESGSQTIINYTPKEYKSTPINWAITQDKRGIMYFGNGYGLLEYDGTTWKLYQVSNNSAILSLAIGDDGKIYAGATGDLGYFLPDSSGKLIFHSLLDFVPKEKRNFSNVWNTYVNSGKVIFNTFNYILIWNIKKREFKIIKPGISFHLMCSVKGTIYVREWGKGLEVLRNDSLTLLKGSEKFANERIYAMLPFPGEEGTTLIVTRTMGLFKYDGSTFIPFKTEADKFLKDNLIYLPGTLLSDNNIFLGTINGGAVVIDSTGREVRRYATDNGIINNDINYTFQDRSGAIWLATFKGISRIDYSSPASYFDSRNNFSASAVDIIRHNGIVYAAANNGVYSLDPKTSMFHPLKNSNTQAWCFLKFGDDLLAGTNDGLFKVDSDTLSAIRKSITNDYEVTVLIKSLINQNRIYVATNSGLWSVLKSGNKWIDEGRIFNQADQPTSLVEDIDGTLWMGVFSNGLVRVKFQKDDKGNIILNKPVAEHFNNTNGLQAGYAAVVKIKGVNYFNTADSTYLFNENKKRFYADTSNQIISAFYKIVGNNTGTVFQPDNLGRVWIGAKGKLEMGTPQLNGSYQWVFSPVNYYTDEGTDKSYGEKNDITWLSSNSGVIKFDFGKKNLDSTNYYALERNVEIGKDSTIYFGGKIDNPVIPEITFKNNSIKFSYSATSYEGKNVNKFKTFLDGFDEGWSSWSTETTKEYTNLPPGIYTFKVVALNVLGIESSTSTYSFEILSPWYRTWWVYCLYTIAAIGLIWLLVAFRSRQLKKQNLALEKKIEHRTAQLKQSLNDLRSAQAQLIQSEKMASLGELTAGIAHEIQNPLNFVNNFSEVNREMISELKEEIDKGNYDDAKIIADDIEANEEKINHHGKRADAIVKGMMQHSQISTGAKEPTDINKLADEYLRLSYHGLRAKDKEFNAIMNTDFDTNIGKINIIPQDIGRVLLNLYNNAFYAVSEKVKQQPNGYEPAIFVTTKKINNKVEITVKDNGSGIPQKVIDKIFQPFFTTKPTGEGTGLGLSLSYDIIKAHGGEIKVNTIEGEFTEFVIQLPISV